MKKNYPEALPAEILALFVKKDCLQHLKVGLNFQNLIFKKEKRIFRRKDFNFDRILKHFLILS